MVFVVDIFHSYGSIIYIYYVYIPLSAVSGRAVELYQYWLVHLNLAIALVSGTLDCFFRFFFVRFVALSLRTLALVIELCRDFSDLSLSLFWREFLRKLAMIMDHHSV